MTTFDSALAAFGRSLQQTAARREARTRARKTASGVLVQLWNLALVLAGLGAFTFAAFTVGTALGFAVGGGCAFALRSLVTWGGESSART